ncbi:lipopolysaccharide assembly protein LapB [Betaproteobacteria bacterium SCN1]|jgi:lipopolysaccharide biosynthesis regulator YciM|nr:lipopolysaccharide assembly protein LapB [Betaproteobacteria bacterium SCN1]MBN8759481.1 lipopolysaccharide assembly protein LapB [Thiobacillus sp.]ODU89788.1 MAG: lipopolysaccharide assembly protein LapB [Thiobacillus sp. SCN 65-179]OJW37716.1 MAG: lipopolysaccharide assembly protein LapB [Thiobacillus sp. 65-69]
MEFELWWLLAFPLFFALGWLAARVDIRQVVTESRALPNSYFRGLNFLLNEQPDKAIEAFLEVVKLEPETIDLHFALGGLFRRRGELDRAIRMHENLLEREGLVEEQRLRAMSELGQDYLKAGLLDRAEQVFARLLDTPQHGQARTFLLEIYVQEKDWKKAIEAARVLEKDTSKPLNAEIAHFHCELALLESAKGDPEAAATHLDEALKANRQSVRANLMAGDLDAAAGRHDAAIADWRMVETQSAAHMALVVERVLGSYRQLDRLAEGVQWLRALYARQPSQDLFGALYLAVSETEGAAAATRLAREELRRNPSLRTLDRLLEAQLLEAAPAERELLQVEKGLVAAHSQRMMRYQCDSCGFKAKQFFWRCPACGRWDSFDPERREGEG